MRVYVGNIPFSMTDDDLRQLFERHGQVSAANVITDRESGRSRGFGFVEMNDENEAKRAIEELNEYLADGRNLVVNEAKPRRNRGGGRRREGGRREGGRREGGRREGGRREGGGHNRY